MSSPLDFLRIFADRLRGAGIRFAITSGMACVHYGLAQNTKDSDWIIRPEDLAKLRDLFAQLEAEGWRVSYRSIFGAPLEQAYLGHGWTSHLSMWNGADSMENKVDIFGQPPRVQAAEIVADAEGWADRHVVAQMKRTDRDKDWPFVDGLGLQVRRGRFSTSGTPVVCAKLGSKPRLRAVETWLFGDPCWPCWRPCRTIWIWNGCWPWSAPFGKTSTASVMEPMKGSGRSSTGDGGWRTTLYGRLRVRSVGSTIICWERPGSTGWLRIRWAMRVVKLC
jgi:hypothetical protein